MRIHRNLHNARHGGPQWVHTVKGIVAEYLEAIQLTDVTTRIQPAGQRKCAAAQVRSVCAYFDGTLATASICTLTEWQRVAYDPRKDTAFQADGKRWNTAEAVQCMRDGSTWVLNPRWSA